MIERMKLVDGSFTRALKSLRKVASVGEIISEVQRSSIRDLEDST